MKFINIVDSVLIPEYRNTLAYWDGEKVYIPIIPGSSFTKLQFITWAEDDYRGRDFIDSRLALYDELHAYFTDKNK